MHNVVSAEGSTGSFYSIVFGPELVVGRPGGSVDKVLGDIYECAISGC